MRIHVFKDALLLACVWPCQDKQNAQHKTAVSGLVLLKKKHQQYSDRQEKVIKKALVPKPEAYVCYAYITFCIHY
jgi:hypothetical protein